VLLNIFSGTYAPIDRNEAYTGFVCDIVILRYYQSGTYPKLLGLFYHKFLMNIMKEREEKEEKGKIPLSYL